MCQWKGPTGAAVELQKALLPSWQVDRLLVFATPANAARGHEIRDSREPQRHSSAPRASLAHHRLPSLLKGINFLFGFINLHKSRPEASALQLTQRKR